MNTDETQFADIATTLYKTSTTAVMAINRYNIEINGIENHVLLHQGIHFNDGLKKVELIILPELKDYLAADTKLTLNRSLKIVDCIEESKIIITDLSMLITSQSVELSVSKNMSRSYSENIRLFGKEVIRYRELIQSQYVEVMNLTKALGGIICRNLSVAEITSEYVNNSTRGVLSTVIYVGGLLTHTDRMEVLEALKYAKYYGLGVTPDSTESVTLDTMILSEYHPIQSMTYYPIFTTQDDNPMLSSSIAFASTFVPKFANTKADRKYPLNSTPSGLRRRQASSIASESKNVSISESSSLYETSSETEMVINHNAVNLGLPQSNLSVIYNLGKLIDRKMIGTYGPVATSNTGLNYKLVDRLKTIETKVITPTELYTKVTEYAPRVGPVAVTLNGTDVRYLHNPNGEDIPWAPFGGSRPLVSSYLDNSAAIILEGIKNDRSEGWTFNIQKQFDESIRNKTYNIGEYSNEIMATTLISEFGKVYDLNPPATSQDFYDIVVSSDYTYDSYIGKAIAKMAFIAIDSQADLWYNRRQNMSIPYKILIKELHITHSILAMDTSKSLWLFIKRSYSAEEEDFKLPSAQKRITLMKKMNDIITAAFTLSLLSNPIVCVHPTVKGYAMSNAYPR